MIKSEIFASVLRDVCEVTGISERDIMSKSKSEEIVDARHLLVVTLRRSGYYPGMIAERLHVSGRAVRKMIGSFRSRADIAEVLGGGRRRLTPRGCGSGSTGGRRPRAPASPPRP